MIFPDEINKDTNIYRSLVLKDIYPENELKEYVNGIKKIITSKEDTNEGIWGGWQEKKVILYIW